MLDHRLASLRDILRPHFDLTKSRLETMAVIMTGMVNCRTVNLSHLAIQFPGQAFWKSNYHRLQRFFQDIRFDESVVAGLTTSLIGFDGPKHLAIDRTNWKLGKTDINILVLAIITPKFKIPIMWTCLNHRGNSSTKQRIDLMERYMLCSGSHQFSPCWDTGNLSATNGSLILLKIKYHFAFAFVRTCILKLKTERNFSFLHSFVNTVKDDGKVGYAVWLAHRRIYCALKEKRLKVIWL